MEVKQVFSNIGSLKIDAAQVLIHSFSSFNSNINDLTLFTHLESVYASSCSRFAQCLAKSETESLKYLKIIYLWIEAHDI